jgi:hypothetical protein
VKRSVVREAGRGLEAATVEPRTLKAGTMMVQEGLLLPKVLEMESEAYSRGWRSVKALDSSSLGYKLAAGGWHLFFVAGQVTTISFGRGGDKSLYRAVKRIAAKVRALDLNCLEVTEIVRKHFLGMPYMAISAHSYHIQPGWQLQNTDERQRSQRDADWARA